MRQTIHLLVDFGVIAAVAYGFFTLAGVMS